MEEQEIRERYEAWLESLKPGNDLAPILADDILYLVWKCGYQQGLIEGLAIAIEKLNTHSEHPFHKKFPEWIAKNYQVWDDTRLNELENDKKVQEKFLKAINSPLEIEIFKD